MRDDGDGAVEALRARLAGDEVAVDDDAAGSFEDAAGHGQAVVVRADFEAAHALSELEGGGSAVPFHLRHVAVPVAAFDGDVGDQVVQVRFVHDEDAGVTEGGVVDEVVMRVIAEMVEGDVELAGVERFIRTVEDRDCGAFRHFGDEGAGIIGNTTLRWRHRREKRGV